MRVLDLFSGIGGFSLGLERAGMRIVAFCESDPFCQRVLAKHWPDVPCHPDVRTIDPPAADVICAGFPCQPYSRAGLRAGASDPRDMVGPMLGLVERVKPAWFIGENTEGFVDIGLDALCVDLERAGYHSWTISLPACAVGLPTMERHVWIIAAASSQRLQRCGEIAVSLIEDGAKELQGSDPRGLDRWHLPTARLCGVGERLPNRLDRLKALGNAVDPHVPEIIGRAIMRVAAPQNIHTPKVLASG